MATSVILRELDPVALIKLFGEERVTHAFLVPAVLQFMLMVPGAEEADYSSLEVFVYGASPISEEVLARSVRMFGCKFWQAYGLTETTGRGGQPAASRPRPGWAQPASAAQLRPTGAGCRGAHRRPRQRERHDARLRGG